MIKQIDSPQNPLIKNILSLKEKSRNRKKQNVFIIEGRREIQIALEANYTIEILLFQPDICAFSHLEKTGFLVSSPNCISISKGVYEKIAYRGSTEGVIAVVSGKDHDIKNAELKEKTPLILVAEAPEKPGNIGAILRTADAANVSMVCIANPKTDLYNPNIIRSSVGCVFSNTIYTGSTDEIIAFLQKNNISIYSAILQEAKDYHSIDYTNASAIVVGTEATGLGEAWRKAAKQNIKIPMQGKIDSLNVSVATGIIIFEAKRQRNFTL